MTLRPAIYSSIHRFIWHFLLASLPLFVISAIRIFWCQKEHSKQYNYSEDGFQKGLYTLVQTFNFLKECKPPLSLCLTVVHHCSQLRLSSMLIPKYFIFFTLLTASLLRTRLGNALLALFNFLLWPKTINSLLLVFKLSLFILIQLDIFSSSFFHICQVLGSGI